MYLIINYKFMNIIEEEQLKIEIKHIFESGANEIRIFEMVKSFINNRNNLPINNISELLVAWKGFKKDNWWESDAIDVEAVLIDKFSKMYEKNKCLIINE